MAPQPGACGTITIATWNILSGRNGGLEAEGRALNAANVDIAILQETKLTGRIYTRQTAGYSVLATNAPSDLQGGVSIFSREVHQHFDIEDE